MVDYWELYIKFISQRLGEHPLWCFSLGTPFPLLYDGNELRVPLQTF